MNNILDIDWKKVLNNIENQDGEIRTIGSEFYKNVDGRFNHIIESWSKAGYTSNMVEWINYYPGSHFDESVSEMFSNNVDLHHIRSWISCIRPGKSAPWHQDIDDQIEKYLELGKLKRFTCFIDEPAHGQVMSIDKKSFYMIPVNTVFEWNDYMDWHGASNCGFKNYYLYHFLGYTK